MRLKIKYLIINNFYVSSITIQIEDERNFRESLKHKQQEENKIIETKLKSMFQEEREVSKP